MAFGVSGIILLICLLVAGTHQESERWKRQLHHTHAPHQQHTTAPHDPLAAWMAATSSSKPNVLFLVADDLRPKLGCYNETNMVTPNLDFLASKSVRFDQAFAQVALCSPSRTSFLTGRRPDTTRVLDLETYFRTVAGNFTTLPEYFKKHGYFAQSVGKVFHPGPASGNTNDYPYSWSSVPYVGDQPFRAAQRQQSTFQPVDESASGKLLDTTIADFAVNFLRNHAHNRDQPFFLAVGFHKPHLPWIFPKEYLNLYPQSSIHLAKYRRRPPHLPDLAWSTSSEIHGFHDIQALHITDPDGHIPDNYQYTLRQGYSAATSFMDAQVGRVMQALNQYGYASNTIVVFLGDHGWHLGDNGEWCKHTNFDTALRIPMMLFVPGVTSVGHGFKFIDALAPNFHSDTQHLHLGSLHSTDELVEAIDLFPTLTELAGLPVPPTCPENSLGVAVCTEGTSLVPLVKKVRGLNQGHNFQWKDAAFSVYHRKWEGRSPVVGYTIRTSTHRYTEWVDFDRDHFRPDFNHVLARELYEHSSDPDEYHNLASTASSRSLVSQLSQKLRSGWRTTLQRYLGSVH